MNIDGDFTYASITDLQILGDNYKWGFISWTTNNGVNEKYVVFSYDSETKDATLANFEVDSQEAGHL